MEPQQVERPARTPVMRWLCTASFINQGFAFLMYGILVLGAGSIRSMPLAEVQAIADSFYGRLLDPASTERMHAFLALLHERGGLLFGIYALRTLVRAYGTWRMWKGELIGLHIYVSAQLLGVLVPMLVFGRELFDVLGFMMVINWCYLYWSARRNLR